MYNKFTTCCWESHPAESCSFMGMWIKEAGHNYLFQKQTPSVSSNLTMSTKF